MARVALPAAAPRLSVRTRVAAGEQLVDELRADVSGGAGDEDASDRACEPTQSSRRESRSARCAVGCPRIDREEARDQGRGGADRRRGRDDPHVGAALRLPRARAHRRPATASTPRRTCWRSGACSPIATAGCRCPAALERARAPAKGTTDRPSIFAALGRRRRPGAPAAAAQADAGRALARDRGGGDRPRRRPGRDRRLPGRAQLPRGRAPLPAAGAGRRRRRRVRRLRRSVGSRTRTSRPRSRSARPTRSATSGRWSSTRPVTPPAWSAGRRRTAGAIASSRRSGRWTPTVVRRAAQVGAALAARAAPDGPSGAELLADRPLAVESPAPGLTALTNRMIGYLDATGAAGGRNARLSGWPPSVKPICASSPAARIAVVTSSVPRGAPIGLGGGSRRARVERQGRGARAARALRLRARWSREASAAALAGASAWQSRRVALADPLGASAGSVPSTPLSVAFGFALRFGAFSAIRGSSVRLDRRHARPHMLGTDPHPAERAALRSAGYETGPQLRVEVDNTAPRLSRDGSRGRVVSPLIAAAGHTYPERPALSREPR